MWAFCFSAIAILGSVCKNKKRTAFHSGKKTALLVYFSKANALLLDHSSGKAQTSNLVSLGTCYHGNRKLDNSEEAYAGAHSQASSSLPTIPFTVLTVLQLRQ